MGGAIGVLVTCAVAHARPPWVTFSPRGFALSAGGGVADFVGSTMRTNARLGPSWDARVLYGTRSPLAFEVGYTGLTNTLATGSAAAPNLVQNSIDGTVRVNLLPWMVVPYIFGGVGYNRADVTNASQDPALAARFRPSDDQLLVPWGGGVAAYLGSHVTIDARFTYRTLFYDDVLVADPGARQDTYTVAGRAGWAF